ncbi:unnamed protein product [Dicrocoelium dendriticum]|nr:unnamed protein product [Dicrocoelium dendriticum]
MSGLQYKPTLGTATMSSEPVVRTEWASFICGGIAGAVSRTMTAPIDRVKVLRQMEVPEMMGKNFVQSWYLMYKEGGFTSLWRGNGVNVLKNCPESAIRFGLHGYLKTLLFPESNVNINLEQRLLVASLAGAASLTCTYPVEILKTRMALRRSTDPKSIASCVRQIYGQGGLCGFYRGYKISRLSYVPYSAWSWPSTSLPGQLTPNTFPNLTIPSSCSRFCHHQVDLRSVRTQGFV